MSRQLYPDTLRAIALVRIVVFHFAGWQLLTYIPSLGIMFALGGWFAAISFSEKRMESVILHRLARLLPTWWAFALISLVAGFFYAQGAGISLELAPAWLFPYERVTWNLDNAYANDITTVTWYIAAYLWFLLFSPLLLEVYKKLSWVAILAPVLTMLLIFLGFIQAPPETVIGETAMNVLIFGGCWMLGFAKADGTLAALPRYLVYMVAVVCSACGIFLTYEVGSLAHSPFGLSIMSFGVALLLLSFNPDLSFIPAGAKSVIRSINTYAVTIYLFHNPLIDVSYRIGSYLHAYEVGGSIGIPSCGVEIGSCISFVILLGLMLVTIKTVGIVETRQWLRKRKPEPRTSQITCENGSC